MMDWKEEKASSFARADEKEEVEGDAIQ